MRGFPGLGAGLVDVSEQFGTYPNTTDPKQPHIEQKNPSWEMNKHHWSYRAMCNFWCDSSMHVSTIIGSWVGIRRRIHHSLFITAPRMVLPKILALVRAPLRVWCTQFDLPPLRLLENAGCKVSSRCLLYASLSFTCVWTRTRVSNAGTETTARLR